MTRYKEIPKNSIRISKSMFMLPERQRSPYVKQKIEKENDKEVLYLRFLNERNENCIKITEKKGSLIETKGYYYSSVPFNIIGDTGVFGLIPTALDGVEYYKVGEKIVNGRK